jgi:hypothetical protein
LAQWNTKNNQWNRITDDFPWIGKNAINEITAPELLSALRRVEKRGAIDGAHRILQNCGQIFRYAIATCRAERNIAADLRGALGTVKKSHLATITDPKEVSKLLIAIKEYRGYYLVLWIALL